jgi:hypothetical protein
LNFVCRLKANEKRFNALRWFNGLKRLRRLRPWKYFPVIKPHPQPFPKRRREFDYSEVHDIQKVQKVKIGKCFQRHKPLKPQKLL